MLTSLFLHQECVNEILNLCYGTRWTQLLPAQKSLSLKKKENQPKTHKQQCSVYKQLLFLYHLLLLFCFIYLIHERCVVCAIIMEVVSGTELRKINGKNPCVLKPEMPMANI